jgi:hypothetical protein
MAKTRESLIINIKLNRMYIVQRLSESIAENLRREFNYDVMFYYRLSMDVLIGSGLSCSYAKALMIDVVTLGYYLDFQFKCTGEYTYHNGSGIHPAILVSKEAEDLCTLIGLLTRDESELNQHEPLVSASQLLM